MPLVIGLFPSEMSLDAVSGTLAGNFELLCNGDVRRAVGMLFNDSVLGDFCQWKSGCDGIVRRNFTQNCTKKWGSSTERYLCLWPNNKMFKIYKLNQLIAPLLDSYNVPFPQPFLVRR